MARGNMMARHQGQKWRLSVDNLLRAGFGVEDIALRLRCPLSTVSGRVETLRESGELAKWWPR